MSEIEQIAQIILKMLIERQNEGLPELSAFHIADELFFVIPKIQLIEGRFIKHVIS